MRLFITGATGFLGYNIVLHAVSLRHDILCLRRSTSHSLFDKETEKVIRWVNIDNPNWKQVVTDYSPDVLIHCAWGGVRGSNRDEEEVQNDNILLSQALYEAYPYKQVIAMGSQAEYGFYEGPINENHATRPLTAYGKAKLKSCAMLQKYCQEKGIEWQWIRIFTIFGERQTGGLIRMFSEKCLNNETCFDTTKGEQIYSYLYSHDFAEAICNMIGAKGKSGIYNMSQPATMKSNKEVIEAIKMITRSKVKVNFGALPYSDNQVMYMHGDVSKYEAAFGHIKSTDFETALKNTINSFKQ